MWFIGSISQLEPLDLGVLMQEREMEVYFYFLMQIHIKLYKIQKIENEYILESLWLDLCNEATVSNMWSLFFCFIFMLSLFGCI